MSEETTMAKPIQATPPLDALAECWAERAKAAWAAGDTARAVECAQKAVDAHDRFGAKSAPEPQVIACCRKLINRRSV